MHYSLLVSTPHRPGEADLHRILGPWHQYESTGIDDEYVIDVDVTDQVMSDWKCLVSVVRLANGTLHSKYDDRFYVKSDGEGLERKEFRLPEGAELLEILQSELSAATGETLRQFAEEWDCKEHGGRFYVHTNPNAKWDWWQIGGRWSGFFAPNYDPEDDPKNKEKCFLCGGTGKRTDMQVENGCNRCKGTGMATKWPTEWRSPGNQVQVSKLPLKELTLEAELKAAANYDKFHKALAGRPYPDWEGLVAEHGIEKAREIFNGDPGVKAVREAGFFFWNGGEGQYLGTREACLKRAREQVLETFAIVKDGKWYQRGETGSEVWSKQFAALLDDLSPDDWLTIVDCHI